MADSPKIADSQKIKVDYTKGTSFRVMHSDGAFGGITPQGDIIVSFYHERHPLPTSMTYEVNPEGAIGKEVRAERMSEARNMVRELEAAVHLKPEVAKSLAEWLLEKVKLAEKLRDRSEANTESVR